MTRFARLTFGGKTRIGQLTDTGFIDLTESRGSLDAMVESGALTQQDGPETALPDDAVYEMPMERPGKIICVGVNFPDRNAEYKDGSSEAAKPSLFIRFPESFTGHEQPLIRPPESEKLDYEGEIAIVIGKAGRRIAQDDAYDHIAALTLCNEGTIRDWVRHAKFNVTQGKNWDRSGALGPWLVPFTDAAQLDDVRLTTKVNGELRQEDRTSRMIYSFRYIINYVSTFTTLAPGDILVCGTPTGAGARFDPPIWLKPGDVIEVEAEGIGVLCNSVEDEA
ncbi:MAG: fumarylacetoacetate hydrolase family protein [Marinovum sp.]|nr:fumarylacetoacetate hydrolase family protein [Marinovum sp.]